MYRTKRFQMCSFKSFTKIGALACAFTAAIAGLAVFIGRSHARPFKVDSIPAVTVHHGALVWSEEFDRGIELSTRTHVGKWRANDMPDRPELGYKDHSGDSWNINPMQHPACSPFIVQQGVLTIAARRTPQAIVPDIESMLGAGKAPAWSGGMLISEPRSSRFRYGYFEVRARWPNPGAGMFPAVWLYVADGRHLNDPSKSGAEIDMLEIFGQPSGKPWEMTAHRRDWLGRGDMDTVGTVMLDTSAWHVYGLDWRPDALDFFRDGVLVGQIEGDDARWFDVDMSIRLNFAVDGRYLAKKGRLSDSTTPTEMRMEVDYVRVYRN